MSRKLKPHKQMCPCPDCQGEAAAADRTPRIVAECWTCAKPGQDEIWYGTSLKLGAVQAATHRAAGHDVRPIAPQKGDNA